eukprot:TRINITY_DN610_c3_g1_i3.p1 TRINITY_DN610_c3_g1~~TRINITY_DN610_c3_g1_i3.p1  ORF type:complete len:335 (-),score=63.65 TRINITY_DN610_c3_g1_i3:34-1038(-)
MRVPLQPRCKYRTASVFIALQPFECHGTVCFCASSPVLARTTRQKVNRSTLAATHNTACHRECLSHNVLDTCTAHASSQVLHHLRALTWEPCVFDLRVQLLVEENGSLRRELGVQMAAVQALREHQLEHSSGVIGDGPHSDSSRSQFMHQLEVAVAGDGNGGDADTEAKLQRLARLLMEQSEELDAQTLELDRAHADVDELHQQLEEQESETERLRARLEAAGLQVTPPGSPIAASTSPPHKQQQAGTPRSHPPSPVASHALPVVEEVDGENSGDSGDHLGGSGHSGQWEMQGGSEGRASYGMPPMAQQHQQQQPQQQRYHHHQQQQQSMPMRA